MPKLTNILVATDLSDRAHRAVNRAAHMAQAQQATLHVVHVLESLRMHNFTASTMDSPMAMEKRLFDATRIHISGLADDLASNFGIVVKSAVLQGRMLTELAQYASTHAIELSVFGAHGDNFVKDVFIGSGVSKYLRKDRHPTLIVRGEEKRAYQHVLVAVDFSPVSKLLPAWAARVAPGAAIHVLHAAELPFEGKMRYAGIAEGQIADYRHEVEREALISLDALLGDIDGGAHMTRSVTYGTPSRTIMAQAQTRKADLVVLGKRGQFEIEEVLLGSVALRILNEADRDLLMVAPDRV